MGQGTRDFLRETAARREIPRRVGVNHYCEYSLPHLHLFLFAQSTETSFKTYNKHVNFKLHVYARDTPASARDLLL